MIDNRGSLRQNNYHSFCATGTGTWSARLQYSDTAITGPFTNFPDSTALVSQASANCQGSAFAYHAFIKILTSGTITLLNYAASKDYFIVGSGGGGGGTVTASLGPLTAGLPVIGNGGTDITVGTVTGTGTQFVTSASPTIVTPTIASFTNAQHNHSNAAGGGVLVSTNLSDTATLIRTTTTLGGDTTGNLPNPVVVKINGTSLAGLATGILKNTTGTGVPSIAVSGTDYVVPAGNVATATALQAAPTICSSGQAAQGILASGNATGCQAIGAGTVTQVTFPTTPAGGWLTASVATNTTTPAISLTATTGLTANQFLATPNGSTGAVGLRAIVAADIPLLTATQMPALTGDVTTPGGSLVTTLATVNSGSGLCGDAAHVCQITTNAKGLVTLQAQVVTGAVTGPGSSTNTNVPQWNGTTGLVLSAGLGVVTTVGSPGSNSNLATEAAVRSAITAGTSGITGPGSTTVGFVPQWGNTVGTSQSAGIAVSTTPGASTIVEAGGGGTIAAGWLPNPSASTLGGVESIAAQSSKWINTISTSGVPSLTQPLFSDISGSVAAGQMPALTGDITSSAGTVATTLATVNGGPGTCGDSTHVCQVVTNGKGLVTSQTAVSISQPGTGTVTHTAGALTLNQLIFGNGGADIAVGDLTGDITTSGGKATTLATVNSGPGLCGDATHVCQVTTNGKGLVTLQAAVAITGAGTSANQALSNLSAVSINSVLGFQSAVDIGSATNPARDLFIVGGGSYGTNYFRLTGTPTAATILTLPNLGNQTLATLNGTETLQNKTLINPVLGLATLPRYVSEPFTNDGTTGTFVNRAVTETSTNNTVIVLPDNATEGAIGVAVSGAGIGGTVQVARMGTVAITFTNTATAGHWAQWATGAGNGGKATDSGIVSTTCPTSGGQIVGVILDGGAAGLHNVELHLRTQCGTGGGGSGISVSINGGAAVGPQATLNVINGTGLAGFTAVVSGSQINLTLAADTGYLNSNYVSLAGNCNSAGGTCGATTTGTVTIAAGSTSVVVGTTKVTANSEILVTFDSSLGSRLGVTCNTTYAAPTITARTAGTSFTIGTASSPSVNPACYSWFLVN